MGCACRCRLPLALLACPRCNVSVQCAVPVSDPYCEIIKLGLSLRVLLPQLYYNPEECTFESILHEFFEVRQPARQAAREGDGRAGGRVVVLHKVCVLFVFRS